MMKKILFLVLVGLVFSSASSAVVLDLQAGDSVKATLGTGYVVPKVGGITVSLDGTTYGDASADINVGGDAIWAGCYVVDIYDMADNLIADQYASFCLDVTADPTTGTALVHAVTDTVAADIKAMWATYYDDAVNTAVEAAAFQLAVWEIVHESGTSYDLATGGFFLDTLNLASNNNNGASLAGLISQANSYLDSSSWTGQANLLSLTREGYQPLTVEVPEPATLALLGLGGLGLLRRKK